MCCGSQLSRLCLLYREPCSATLKGVGSTGSGSGSKSDFCCSCGTFSSSATERRRRSGDERKKERKLISGLVIHKNFVQDVRGTV